MSCILVTSRDINAVIYKNHGQDLDKQANKDLSQDLMTLHVSLYFEGDCRRTFRERQFLQSRIL